MDHKEGSSHGAEGQTVEQCGDLGSRSPGWTPPGAAPPHVSVRCVPEGHRPECAGLTFFYHPWAEKGSLNKQKAPITKGKTDESTQSRMRKLRVTEHAINTAVRPPDAEATFTARVTSGGLTPRLHGGPLHSCTTVKREGQPGSWRGREQGPQERESGGRLSHGHHHHQDTQDKASARPHFRTTRWAEIQVLQTGALVRLWSTGDSPSEGRAEGAGISGAVRDPAGAARACPGPSR